MKRYAVILLVLAASAVSAQTVNYTPEYVVLMSSAAGLPPFAPLTTSSGIGAVNYTPTIMMVPMCSATGSPPYSQCSFSSGSGTVTHTGALTLNHVTLGNGTADVKVDTGCTTDGAGALSCGSISTTGGGVDNWTAIADPGSPTDGNDWYSSTTAYRRKFRGNATTQTYAWLSDIGTWGALNYPAYASGTPFVKMTAAGMFALDTNTYQQTLTGTGLVRQTGAATELSGDATTSGSNAVSVVKVNGNTPGATCTNQVVTAIDSSARGTCTSLATAYLPTAIDTRTVTVTDIGPVTGDDNLIVVLDPATAVHLTRISCGVTGTTSVITNLTSGGNSLIADMTATAGTVNQVVVTTWANGSSQCGGTSSCAVAAHAPVTLHIGTISGAPTSVSCAVDYTVD